MDSDYLTLTPNTVGTITLDDDYVNLEVVSDGTAEVFYTVNGDQPTIRGRGTYWLPAGLGGVEDRVRGSGYTTIRLISAGAPKVYVRGW